MNPEIQIILVPAGVEYRAVKRAVSRVQGAPQVVAIPAGPRAVKRFLETWKDRALLWSGGVLVVGLGGSLSSEYGVGDGVLLERVWNGFEKSEGEDGEQDVYECDRTLTTQIAERLAIATGTGVTCDRVITTVDQKRELCDRYGADIVDMEGAALLKVLPNAKVAILRVVSDDCHHDLPDISNAISSDGSIKPLPIAFHLSRRPTAAIRLIRGSLKGLKSLETLIAALFE
ncbi:MAG: hypothetical protein AAF152_11395 [Cyanobacteria bacterium P01_A01_bin.114]